MKRLAALALVLCSAAMRCDREDTKPAPGWRTAEPRLSGVQWAPYRRRPAHKLPACAEQIRSHEAAANAIASQPQCIAEAIKTLRSLPPSSRIRNDLAAAYYVRAEIEDQPKYLLNAWESVHGLSGAEACFNLALIQEKLGLAPTAESSWRACQAGDASPWGKEARRHLDVLVNEQGNAASAQWPVNRRKLRDALAAGDRARVAELIRPFSTPAQTYLEDVVIPQWARSGAGRDLDAARLLADEVSKLQQDPFAHDVVAAITKATDRRLLREAHTTYEDARLAEIKFAWEEATEDYEKALRLLTRGRSPLRYTAEIGAVTNGYLADIKNAQRRLERLAREVQPELYPHTAAHIMSTLAFILNDSGNHIAAAEQYSSAEDTFRRLHDFESVTAMQSARSGVLIELGDNAEAWRVALATNEYAPEIQDLRRRHVRLGALGLAAEALGHPALAIEYQNEAVVAVEQELANEPPQNLAVIEGLRHHLSIARRRRAEMRIANGSALDQAMLDISEALRLADDFSDKKARTYADLLQRIHEVRGLLLLRSDANGAAEAFTKAIELLSEPPSPNIHASLLSQRAAAYRLAGRRQESEADLKAALEELHRDEAIQLENRKSAKEEDIWGPYFERYQETYRQLIALLVEDGKNDEAFEHAERAKAFEPLDLILKLPFVPQRFRELTKGREPIVLTDIQATLPANTYLLQYCVLEDRTLVWIISNGPPLLLQLPVRRDEIAALRAAIQDAVDQSDERRLNRSLQLAYGRLMEEPWKQIPKTADGELPRIVIVPDGDMRALPFNVLRNPARGYLFEDAIVSVHGSATLYIFSRLRNNDLKTNDTSALLIGDPEFDKQFPDAADLERLEHAQAEVESISRFYPNAVVRTGKDATVPDALQRAATCSMIHIAAHGVVNESNPSESSILLAKTPNDFGRLDAQRLAGLRLPQTRLVVLASCSSAGDPTVGPEGVAPLVRPFVGAGVPGIVGSLWEFPDATAKPLLVSFHRHYRAEGKDAATALREAQLEALDGKKPLLAWAPFEVIGYASLPAAAPAATMKEKPP